MPTAYPRATLTSKRSVQPGRERRSGLVETLPLLPNSLCFAPEGTGAQTSSAGAVRYRSSPSWLHLEQVWRRMGSVSNDRENPHSGHTIFIVVSPEIFSRRIGLVGWKANPSSHNYDAAFTLSESPNPVVGRSGTPRLVTIEGMAEATETRTLRNFIAGGCRGRRHGDPRGREPRHGRAGRPGPALHRGGRRPGHRAARTAFQREWGATRPNVRARRVRPAGDARRHREELARLVTTTWARRSTTRSGRSAAGSSQSRPRAGADPPQGRNLEQVATGVDVH